MWELPDFAIDIKFRIIKNMKAPFPENIYGKGAFLGCGPGGFGAFLSGESPESARQRGDSGRSFSGAGRFRTRFQRGMQRAVSELSLHRGVFAHSQPQNGRNPPACFPGGLRRTFG